MYLSFIVVIHNRNTVCYFFYSELSSPKLPAGLCLSCFLCPDVLFIAFVQNITTV